MDETTMDDALKAIGEDMGEDAAKKVTWLHCDLAEWPKVTEIADKISSSTDRIDILIGDAARGIMTYQLTDYGVDRHMAVNVCISSPNRLTYLRGKLC
jgi:NAD(P)-dependent dehydrogenase (short-subunit alcohol dehydrogenase family)